MKLSRDLKKMIQQLEKLRADIESELDEMIEAFDAHNKLSNDLMTSKESNYYSIALLYYLAFKVKVLLVEHYWNLPKELSCPQLGDNNIVYIIIIIGLYRKGENLNIVTKHF